MGTESRRKEKTDRKMHQWITCVNARKGEKGSRAGRANCASGTSHACFERCKWKEGRYAASRARKRKKKRTRTARTGTQRRRTRLMKKNGWPQKKR